MRGISLTVHLICLFFWDTSNYCPITLPLYAGALWHFHKTFCRSERTRCYPHHTAPPPPTLPTPPNWKRVKKVTHPNKCQQCQHISLYKHWSKTEARCTHWESWKGLDVMWAWPLIKQCGIDFFFFLSFFFCPPATAEWNCKKKLSLVVSWHAV